MKAPEPDPEQVALEKSMETGQAKPHTSSSTQQVTTGRPFNWTPEQGMQLCELTLLFGIAVTMLAGFLIWKGFKAADVLRTLGILSILTLAAFFIPAGYNNQQIAPLMGLFGTVAGYLLGKLKSNSADKQEIEQP